MKKYLNQETQEYHYDSQSAVDYEEDYESFYEDMWCGWWLDEEESRIMGMMGIRPGNDWLEVPTRDVFDYLMCDANKVLKKDSGAMKKEFELFRKEINSILNKLKKKIIPARELSFDKPKKGEPKIETVLIDPTTGISIESIKGPKKSIIRAYISKDVTVTVTKNE